MDCRHMHFEVISSSTGDKYAVTDCDAVYGYHYGHLGNTALFVKRNGIWRSYFNKQKTLADYPNDGLTENQLNTALEIAQKAKAECLERA